MFHNIHVDLLKSPSSWCCPAYITNEPVLVQNGDPKPMLPEPPRPMQISPEFRLAELDRAFGDTELAGRGVVEGLADDLEVRAALAAVEDALGVALAAVEDALGVALAAVEDVLR